MAANAVAIPTSLPHLEPLAGASKGKFFELSGERVSLGRADSNDVVVEVEGVSRDHAVLVKAENSWYIQDLNSKNGVLVNGKKVQETWLADGDVVQMGNFVFRFRDPEAAAAPAYEAPAAVPDAAAMGMDYGAAGGMALGNEMPVAKKKPNRRLLIYGVLGAIVAVFYLADTTPKDTGPQTESKLLEQREQVKQKIDALADAAGVEQAKLKKQLEEQLDKIDRDLAQRSRDFDAAKNPGATVSDALRKSSVVAVEDPIFKAAEAEMAKLDWSNPNVLESEQFFRRGQREYLQGSLQRSIDSFQTALSFYRGHRLAEHYLQRALYETETEAKKNFRLGLQYFESLQYQRAMYHFQEAVSLMAHRPKEKIVAESERYVALCKRALQAAELFQ